MNKVTEIVNEADKNWGAFRKWLAANPLTGFWSGVAGTVVIMSALWGMFG
jgi:hypothetical protein